MTKSQSDPNHLEATYAATRHRARVQEYFLLKKQIGSLSARLEKLNKQIKDYELRDQEELHGVVSEVGRYWVTTEVRRGMPKTDTGALEQLLVDKNLWAECTRVQVDTSLVEQAYIEGKLTDNDLREIMGVSKPQVALYVTEVKKDI